ncbi:uncharacterized protein LOC134472614 [Cavia porcellus]|uniref:uncharacterized protein LOC134472614 n=1 Tax=Cavia porcellus TaxID=10141 RepID=UPI002FDFD5DA
MRTLALLAALFLLALLAQAEPIPEKAEDITEEHSEDEDDYQKAFSPEDAETSEEAGTQGHRPGPRPRPPRHRQHPCPLSLVPGQRPHLQDPELAQASPLSSILRPQPIGPVIIRPIPPIRPPPRPPILPRPLPPIPGLGRQPVRPKPVVIVGPLRKQAQWPGEEEQQGI